MRRVIFLVIAWLIAAPPAGAQSVVFPKTFKTQMIVANGTELSVRVGGEGPAVVLLHGYGETGDMWAPLAEDLAKDHLVIAPDLRGMGHSARAETGFEKKNQAEDIAAVLDALDVHRVSIVAHDIGNMVAFAFAAQHPDRVERAVFMDAPVPGVGPWDEILKNPLLWHFRFGGADMERLVDGRERIYLDRFWNDFSADPSKFSESSRRHYAALYARRGAMHAGFMQFAAFDQDAADNRALLEKGRLKMPVLAVGGDHSFGAEMAFVMRFAADDVEEAVVKDAGHWLMEEQPAATMEIIKAFLADKKTDDAKPCPPQPSL
jgi:pimeloyl-ACP methyl ester carboxylesterase